MSAVVGKKKKRKWKRWALLAGMAVIGGVLAVPFVFTGAVLRMVIGRTGYGRFSPTFSAARLSPSGRLEVDGLQLVDIEEQEKTGGTPALLQADKVVVGFHWWALAAEHLDTVEMSGVVGHVRFEDGRLTLLRLENPEGKAAAATAPAGTAAPAGKSSEFRVGHLHLTGELEVEPIQGVTMPSARWGMEGTLSMPREGELSVDATLTGEKKAADAGAAVDFHLQEATGDMSMNGTATGLTVELPGALMRKVTAEAAGADGLMRVGLGNLRGGATMPAGGGGSYWFEAGGGSAALPESLGGGEPVRVEGFSAVGDGGLGVGERRFADATVNVRSLKAADVLARGREFKNVAGKGNWRGGMGTVDAVSCDLAGGHVEAHGAWDWATGSYKDVGAEVREVRVSEAVKPFLPAALPVDGRVSATIGAKGVKFGDGILNVRLEDASVTKGTLVVSELEGLALPSQSWEFSGTANTAADGSLGGTMVAEAAGSAGEHARSTATMRRDKDGVRVEGTASGVVVGATGAFFRRVAPKMTLLPEGVGMKVGQMQGACVWPAEEGKAASYWYEVGDLNVQTPAGARDAVKILHVAAGGDGLIPRGETDSGETFFAVRHLAADSILVAGENVEKAEFAGMMRKGMGYVQWSKGEIAGGKVDAWGTANLDTGVYTDVNMNLHGVSLRQAARSFMAGEMAVDGKVSAAIGAGSVDVTRGVADLRLGEARVKGQVVMGGVDGLTMPGQSWGLEGSANSGADGAMVVAATATSQGDGNTPAKMTVKVQKDAKALTVEGTVSGLAVSAGAVFMKNAMPRLTMFGEGIGVTLAGMQGAYRWPVDGSAASYWYEVQDLSVQTPAGAKKAVAVMHLSLGGDGAIPKDAKSWKDAFFAVRHLEAEKVAFAGQNLDKVALAGMLQKQKGYLQWVDADLAGGRVKGYAQYDLANNVLTDAGLELSKIEMHKALGNLAPQYVDDDGPFDGKITLAQPNAGGPIGGNVVLTAVGPGILHVHNVPGLEQNLAAAQGNKYADVALAEIANYHYVSGNVNLDAAGPDTVATLNFDRDMTVPGIPLPGGMDAGGQSVATNVKWPKIDQLKVHITGMPLQEIIMRASGIPALLKDTLKDLGQ